MELGWYAGDGIRYLSASVAIGAALIDLFFLLTTSQELG